MLLVLMITSCEKDIYLSEVDCANCYTEKPTRADLDITLTINDENPHVPLVVYRKEFEERIIVWVDTVSETNYSIEVPVNRYYSVTAEYSSGTRTIFAVDGDMLETKKITGQCDETCWIIRGGIINVKLKYD
jgi:hypothetical protein